MAVEYCGPKFCQKMLDAVDIPVFDRCTELILYGKWLKQEGLEETLKLLPQLRSLRSVEFVDVEIDDIRLSELRRAMPNCKIEKSNFLASWHENFFRFQERPIAKSKSGIAT